MPGLAERYTRILEPLYRIAREAPSEGERNAAKRRIAAIEQRMKVNGIRVDNAIKFSILEQINREAEERAQAELRKQEILRQQAEAKRQEDLRRQAEERRKNQQQQAKATNKQEQKWKNRAKQKQKTAISKEERFAMRANWMNTWVKLMDRQEQTNIKSEG